MTKIGELLNDRMRKLNLTQEQVGLAIGVSGATISNLIYGKHKTKLNEKQVKALSKMLKIKDETIAAALSDTTESQKANQQESLYNSNLIDQYILNTLADISEKLDKLLAKEQ